jgi:hypothetical protein
MDFNNTGSLLLKSVYTSDIINEFNIILKDFMVKNDIYIHLKKRHDVIENIFFVNNTYTSLDSYQKMQFYYLPVIDNRGSHNRSNDVGMIDIYNVDKLIPEIIKYFDISLFQSLLYKLTGSKWKLLRTNIHLCNNVINPNSYHFDNTDKCIKINIFLSDVKSLDDGPIVYINETHLIKNNIKNENIKIYMGNKGDILISFQNGFHRKLPQKNNNTVGYLVFNFIEDKNKIF